MKNNSSIKFSKTLLAGLCFALSTGSASASILDTVEKGLESAGNTVAGATQTLANGVTVVVNSVTGEATAVINGQTYVVRQIGGELVYIKNALVRFTSTANPYVGATTAIDAINNFDGKLISLGYKVYNTNKNIDLINGVMLMYKQVESDKNTITSQTARLSSLQRQSQSAPKVLKNSLQNQINDVTYQIAYLNNELNSLAQGLDYQMKEIASSPLSVEDKLGLVKNMQFFIAVLRDPRFDNQLIAALKAGAAEVRAGFDAVDQFIVGNLFYGYKFALAFAAQGDVQAQAAVLNAKIALSRGLTNAASSTNSGPNEVQRALTRLANTAGSFSSGVPVTQQVRDDMKFLATALKFIGPDASAPYMDKVTNSSISINVVSDASAIGGVKQSYGIAMNLFPSADGSYEVGYVSGYGGSVGAQAGAGQSYTLTWSPGSIKNAVGASVGVGVAGMLDSGVSVGVNWDPVALGKDYADVSGFFKPSLTQLTSYALPPDAIPSFTIGIGSAEVELALDVNVGYTKLWAFN